MTTITSRIETATTTIENAATDIAASAATLRAFTPRGNWSSGTTYSIRDLVIDASNDFGNGTGIIYVLTCTSLTSTNPSSELSAGNWAIYQNSTTNAITSGTFTPVVKGVTTAGTGTYVYQHGEWTKIGNRLFYNFGVEWTAHTGSGNIYIDGLPENADNSQFYYPGVVSTFDLVFTAPPICLVFQSTNEISIGANKSGSNNYEPVTLSGNGSAGIEGSGSYIVA